ncbi:MAG: hypothetical protein IJC58_07400 [Oscillospiraceae bacterium]|nr:hypothetical protein [Oscillospiraceae bacterium]
MLPLRAGTKSSGLRPELFIAIPCRGEKNIFQGVCKKDASDKQVMVISRITLLVLAAIGNVQDM